MKPSRSGIGSSDRIYVHPPTYNADQRPVPTLGTLIYVMIDEPSVINHCFQMNQPVADGFEEE